MSFLYAVFSQAYYSLTNAETLLYNINNKVNLSTPQCSSLSNFKDSVLKKCVK